MLEALTSLIAFYLIRAIAAGGAPLLAGVVVAVVVGALTGSDTGEIPQEF